ELRLEIKTAADKGRRTIEPKLARLILQRAGDSLNLDLRRMDVAEGGIGCERTIRKSLRPNEVCLEQMKFAGGGKGAPHVDSHVLSVTPARLSGLQMQVAGDECGHPIAQRVPKCGCEFQVGC